MQKKTKLLTLVTKFGDGTVLHRQFGVHTALEAVVSEIEQPKWDPSDVVSYSCSDLLMKVVATPEEGVWGIELSTNDGTVRLEVPNE